MSVSVIQYLGVSLLCIDESICHIYILMQYNHAYAMPHINIVFCTSVCKFSNVYVVIIFLIICLFDLQTRANMLLKYSRTQSVAAIAKRFTK